jgi:hypothetical protein
VRGSPPSYPRIAQLIPGRGSRDDLVLSGEDVAGLLAGPILVEEKLDGANVVIWADNEGRIDVATRGGPGAMDRAGLLGALRAWVAQHHEPLNEVLGDWSVLYAEWLLVTHTVSYDRLPSYLVVQDLWREGDGFALPAVRDVRCDDAGLVTPPEVWQGQARSVGDIEGRLGTSAWGSAPMEGLVVRTLDGRPPRLAKLVRAGWRQTSDEEWRSGRPRNRLAEGESLWC